MTDQLPSADEKRSFVTHVVAGVVIGLVGQLILTNLIAFVPFSFVVAAFLAPLALPLISLPFFFKRATRTWALGFLIANLVFLFGRALVIGTRYWNFPDMQ